MKLTERIHLCGSGAFGLTPDGDCHCYVLDGGSELALIDCGLAGNPQSILFQMEKDGLDISRLKYVLLTHAHPDHSNGCAWLREHLGIQVIASGFEAQILEKGLLDREHLIVSHRTEEGCQRSREKFGIEATQDNMRVVEVSQCIVLAVKPQYYQQVIRQIRDNISAGHLIISIAPGKTLAWLEECFVKDVKVVRTMPNTPAQVGAGMTGICANSLVTADELHAVKRIFASFGRAEVVSESMMDAVVSVSGSAPAYVFLFLEALADAAVGGGIPPEKGH